jgi:osmotically-inducible protein OsmY
MIKSDTSKLSKNSKKKIYVSCDICFKDNEITYQSYNKNIKRGGFYSCKKCSSVKRKKTNLEKWGVENPMKLESVKDKIKQTSLDRYGVENVFQSNEVKDKIKQTNLDRYGVFCSLLNTGVKDKIKNTNLKKYGHEHAMKSELAKDKIKQTSLDRYGVENVFQSNEVKDKIKQTNLDRYGVYCSLLNTDVKEKIKQTNLDRYGHEHAMKSESVKDKIKQTNLDKYRVDSYFKTEEYHSNTNIGKDIYYIKYLGNSISVFKCDYERDHEFEINIDNYIGRKRSNLPLCTVCNPIGDLKSIKEKELFEFIKSIYDSEVIQSYRDGLEIDIYLPNLNLGFEFNGLYWNSELYKDKWYHLNKTKYFKEKGIRIFHIWEDDWLFKRSILESQINNWLGLTTNKIFARKCNVKEIKDSKIVTKFLEDNHIQGKVGSCLKLGLYYENKLVSIMTFDHYEGRNKMSESEWNINRFCNKLNTNIIGGASKLFKYFLKNYEINNVISYSDNDWSLGLLYETLGFKKVNESEPDYKYIFKEKRVHKSRFRKSKTGISESRLKLLKIYDCGKIKYEINDKN